MFTAIMQVAQAELVQALKKMVAGMAVKVGHLAVIVAAVAAVVAVVGLEMAAMAVSAIAASGLPAQAVAVAVVVG